MVAIDSAAIMHWLMPTTMVRRAIGSCTWRSIWRLVRPMRAGRLDGGRRDRADAVLGDPDERRQRVDDGQHDARRPAPMPKNSASGAR